MANDGKLKPGKSGNPKGRPRGAGQVARWRARLAKDIPGVLDELVHLAKSGDIQAAKIVMSAAIPPLKAEPREIPFQVPDDGDIRAQADQVVAAALSGCVPLSQAREIVSLLADRQKYDLG